LLLQPSPTIVSTHLPTVKNCSLTFTKIVIDEIANNGNNVVVLDILPTTTEVMKLDKAAITGRDLYAERKKLNISQEALAKHAKVNRGVLSAIERMVFTPLPNEMQRLWNVLQGIRRQDNASVC
jgi:hypothetical protein